MFGLFYQLDMSVQAGPVWLEFLAAPFVARVQEDFSVPRGGFPTRTILSFSYNYQTEAWLQVIMRPNPMHAKSEESYGDQ